MPIFHDNYHSTTTRDSRDDQTWHHAGQLASDGRGAGNATVQDSSSEWRSVFMLSGDTTSPSLDARQGTLDRVSLIERLKRSQSPSAPEPQNVSIYWDVGNSSWTETAQPPVFSSEGRAFSRERPPSRPKSRQRLKSPTTPAREPQHVPAPATSHEHEQEQTQDNYAAGLSIERPRSALHSGDFRQERDAVYNEGLSRNQPLSTSPVAPWHHSFPAAAFPHLRGGADQTQTRSEYPFEEEVSHRRALRSRATSQSSLSSFVLLPPTSPLVHQSNNTDLDWSPRPRSRQTRSPERDNRRHTFSPQSLQTYHATTHSATRPLPSIKREGIYPYQAHQPARRSLSTVFGPHSNSTPQTPLLRPRRPSISSESSPVPHAPMVGSYEESILRGRMSTTPSRPLNFIAQIGVLGRGQCKPNLRCPPHVTLPFPAVFYSYNSGKGRIAENEPSPYVGLIDLENSMKPAEESSDGRRRRRHPRASHHSDHEESGYHNGHHEQPTDAERKAAHRKKEKTKRRSTSPKSPPGGYYRIPQQGQLQIVIKNPNKTAVKLFLVPYDLSDMEPGQKTFIRQRSYSAGPLIDMPLNSRTNFGTDRPEASLSTSEDPSDRPILRYLIHLHICCPSRGRFFLYKAIRVVFANRVPDGKEKLRNEIQLPDPRYSVYKPSRDVASTPPASSSAALSAEKAFRRRSAGMSLGRAQASASISTDAFDLGGSSYNRYTPYGSYAAPPSEPIAPIPFSLSRHHRRLETLESRPSSRDAMDLDGSGGSMTQSAFGAAGLGAVGIAAGNSSGDFSMGSSVSVAGNGNGGGSGSGTASGSGDGAWDKRDRGSFAAASGVGAGLLAQRLRGLGVEQRRGSVERERESGE